MSRALLVVVPLACLFACHKAPSPNLPAAAACDGGACSIGDSCAASADCTFGSCDAGTCAAPGAGPAPTGAVQAQIAIDGGTLSAVSSEHVAFTLDFPAAALSQATQLTATPQPPEAGTWLSLRVDPGAVALQKPVQLSVTLPPGVPAADGMLRLGGATAAVLLRTSVSGSTLTASLPFFHLPAHSGAARPAGSSAESTAGLFDPGQLFEALPLPLNAQIALARLLLAAVRLTGRPSDVLSLQALVASLLQKRMQPQDSAEVSALLDEMFNGACTEFQAARKALTDAPPGCAAEGTPAQQRMLQWVSVIQTMGQGIQKQCTGLDDGGYFETLTASMQTAGNKQYQKDKAAYDKCTCQHVQALGLQVEVAEACMNVPSRGAAAVIPDDLLLPASVYAAAWAADTARVEGATAAADLLMSDEQGGLFAEARKHAFESCRAASDQTPAGRLLQRVPQNAAVQHDARYCAAKIDYEVLDHAGGTASNGSFQLPAFDSADGAGVPLVQAGPDDTLSLSGPLPALHCPPALDGSAPASIETENLIISVAGKTGEVEVARQASDSQGNLLASPKSFTIKSLLSSAGLDLATAANVELHIARDSPGCNGLYGSSPVRLFTVTVSLGLCAPPAPATFCATQVSDPSNTLAAPLYVFDLNDNGVAVVYGLDGAAYRSGLWRAGTVTLLPDQSPSGRAIDFSKLNNSLVVLGGKGYRDTNSCPHAEAYLWQAGNFTRLGSSDSEGFTALNESTVTGSVATSVDSSGCPAGGEAVLWSSASGAQTALGSAGSSAHDVNAAGTVLGQIGNDVVVWTSGGASSVVVSNANPINLDDYGTVLATHGTLVLGAGARPLPSGYFPFALGKGGHVLASAQSPGMVLWFNTRDGSQAALSQTAIDPSLGWDASTLASSAGATELDRHGRIFGTMNRNGAAQGVIVTPAGVRLP